MPLPPRPAAWIDAFFIDPRYNSRGEREGLTARCGFEKLGHILLFYMSASKAHLFSGGLKGW